MKVTNNTSGKISVAVSRWGTDGSTDYFNIECGKYDTWDRSDERGFIMSLRANTSTHSYFIKYNSDIYVSNNLSNIIVEDKVGGSSEILKPLTK
jgi:hypothetical protein